MLRQPFQSALFLTVATLAALLPSRTALADDVVHHQSFEDFTQGSFGDGGANIYVSSGGTIQLIPRWDINRDGHLDLLINQDHNLLENVDAFIHWGTPQGYHSLFPAFWKELPGFKLVRAMDLSRKHITFLPTFGGGPVKLVDLNRDGSLDIVFPNTIHNYFVDLEAYIYWGGREGYSPRLRTQLPTLFAKDLAVADFNRDDYLDLAFANFGDESGDRFGYRNHLASFIYWGSPDGFSRDGRSTIPSLSAVSCAAGDFNGDQWPDLALANNNLRHKSVYVYLGRKEGFDSQHRLVIEGGNPAIVRSGDLNHDGMDELIVSSRGEGSDIYYGKSPFQLVNPRSLPTQHVRDAITADLDRDSHVDIVFASGAGEVSSKGPGEEAASTTAIESMSAVYWGAEGGFDERRILLLPTLSPRAVTTADLNNDTYPEIIFANETDGQTYDVPSYIYWGSQHGFDASARTHLQGFGPVGVAADDLNRDGRVDIVLMNQLTGRQGGIPSVVYWGNPAHRYSEANATLLPTENPYYSKIADLNDDGYPDLVFSGRVISIYWGSPSGLKRRTVLDIRSFSLSVADFNKDGYLDLGLVTTFLNPSEREKTHARIVWGSMRGFSEQNTTRIPVTAIGTHGLTTADLNQDGYLDLVFPASETPDKVSEIVWGNPDGFGQIPSTLLETNNVSIPRFADLDANGWLDLIFPGAMNMDTGDPHTKTLIYWGTKEGFSESRRTELEAYSSLAAAVADLNRDGHLDIVLSNYKAARTRSLPIFVYWGNQDHEYSEQNRTELPAESSCAIQVLDLNQDGYREIIVHNHIKDGDHSHGSSIYWGGEEGYSVNRRDHLPSMGPHFGLGITPGNIYDRSPGHQYQSPAVEVPAAIDQVTLDWKGETPYNTAIQFNLRTGKDETELATAIWSRIVPGKPFRLPEFKRLLQYRATLISPDGGNTPLLHEVSLSLKVAAADPGVLREHP